MTDVAPAGVVETDSIMGSKYCRSGDAVNSRYVARCCTQILPRGAVDSSHLGGSHSRPSGTVPSSGSSALSVHLTGGGIPCSGFPLLPPFPATVG